jgi:dTDP-4-dehydrorhamnose reductase
MADKPVCAVLGASGFLGQEAVQVLRRSFDVVPTSMKPRGEGGYRQLDIRDPAALSAFLRETRPDRVVALAAYREPDVCEEFPAETRRLNTEPMKVLVQELPPEVPILFVSTDYVFDGKHPPYKEDAERRPLSEYGKSKAEAEDIVRTRSNALVLRVPLLMGWTDQFESSGYFSQLINDLKATETTELDDVLRRFPVWTRDVGEAIRTLLEQGETGVFHFSTTRPLTRYRAALEMAELIGWPTSHLVPSSRIIPRKAPRPDDSQLDSSKWKNLGYAMPHDFRDVALRFLHHFGVVPPIA